MGLSGIGKINNQSVQVDTRGAYLKCWGDEITGARINDFYSYFNVPKKTSELTEVEDIVYNLSELGIITNVELWKKKLKNDINDYWLARKAANYLK